MREKTLLYRLFNIPRTIEEFVEKAKRGGSSKVIIRKVLTYDWWRHIGLCSGASGACPATLIIEIETLDGKGAYFKDVIIGGGLFHPEYIKHYAKRLRKVPRPVDENVLDRLIKFARDCRGWVSKLNYVGKEYEDYLSSIGFTVENPKEIEDPKDLLAASKRIEEYLGYV